MMLENKALGVMLELRPLTSLMVMEWQRLINAIPADAPKHQYANEVLKAALTAGWVAIPAISPTVVDSMAANTVEWMAQKIRAYHVEQTTIPPD